MGKGDLGRVYEDGEVIVRQDDRGNCMYVIQQGRVDVLHDYEGQQMLLRSLSKGDFFGELALFGDERRTATVRASGEARVLTVDKRTLMRRIQEDPSFAFRILETMSRWIRELSAELARAKIAD